MIKKIAFPLISIFLAYQTYVLAIKIIRSSPDSYNSVEAWIIGFLLSLYATGIFAFIGFIFPTYKALPGSYFRLRNPQLLNSFSRIIGINCFKKVLLLLFWGRGSNRSKFFDGTRTGIENLEYQTKQAETGHLAALTLISALIIPFVIYSHHALLLPLFAFNLIGNFYPILLQRTHRIRIEKVLDRVERT